MVTSLQFLITKSIHYKGKWLWEFKKWSPKEKCFDLLSFNSLLSQYSTCISENICSSCCRSIFMWIFKLKGLVITLFLAASCWSLKELPPNDCKIANVNQPSLIRSCSHLQSVFVNLKKMMIKHCINSVFNDERLF